MKFIQRTLKSYLKELSSDSPIPGGGGTSGLVAALGAALGLMVAAITQKKLRVKSKRDHLMKLAGDLRCLELYFEKSVDRDPKVYGRVMRTYRNARKMKDKKRACRLVDRVLKSSFEEQFRLASNIALTGKKIKEIGKLSAGSIANDLLVASALLHGAWKGAYFTSRINVRYVYDAGLRKILFRKLAKMPRP